MLPEPELLLPLEEVLPPVDALVLEEDESEEAASDLLPESDLPLSVADDDLSDLFSDLFSDLLAESAEGAVLLPDFV